MNSENKKFNWISFASILGIALAAIALCGAGITISKWNDSYQIQKNDSILNFVLSFTAVAWIGELICGIFILKRRKILGRILILIAILVFLFCALLPAHT
ncbi:MAG TPA: hypothetical protein VK810_02515 [Dongiaceae bacterium]|jgi:hypothetical protein|nr:hypothetical protein [Dongiaceae bacterium]